VTITLPPPTITLPPPTKPITPPPTSCGSDFIVGGWKDTLQTPLPSGCSNDNRCNRTIEDGCDRSGGIKLSYSVQYYNANSQAVGAAINGSVLIAASTSYSSPVKLSTPVGGYAKVRVSYSAQEGFCWLNGVGTTGSKVVELTIKQNQRGVFRNLLSGTSICARQQGNKACVPLTENLSYVTGVKCAY
jgi:hypothetical protein